MTTNNPSASQISHKHWFRAHTETVPIRHDSSEAAFLHFGLLRQGADTASQTYRSCSSYTCFRDIS